jgi:hydrogenase maturation protease
MNQPAFAVLGVGNILERDDGVAVYAAAYLQSNYSFDPPVRIINGGVEGINLLNVFMEHDRILILDAIDIDDAPGSIYHIPAFELSGYGLGSGGAHEIGVMQCFDMLELMGKALPEASVVGIVPETVTVDIGLTKTLTAVFERYVGVIVGLLAQADIKVREKDTPLPLEAIIARFRQSGDNV